MKPHIPLGLLAAALTVTMHAAQAESFRDRQIDERFAAADKDKDGKLTLDEARAGMPRVADNFDKIDSQKRGYVTLEQIKAAADK
ncbi:MAG: hypothetical protein RIQ55_144 [Pseudomonadota bacterium]|jgi:Ca2+-binding EF-hand superfamily protein